MVLPSELSNVSGWPVVYVTGVVKFRLLFEKLTANDGLKIWGVASSDPAGATADSTVPFTITCTLASVQAKAPPAVTRPS